MKLTKVTLTGADESVDPLRLIELSQKFPFVEWGILFSRRSMGTPRYPGTEWLNLLHARAQLDFIVPAQFSAHLCGAYVRELLLGNAHVIKNMGDIWNLFKRVQINTHGEPHEFDATALIDALSPHRKEIIFQIDDVNAAILLAVHARGGLNCAALFDLSSGAGVVPERWPTPMLWLPCGYAGGLGPDNLQEQLERIEHEAGPVDVWIDMETKLRSSDDKHFDIRICERVLEICADWTKD